MHSFFCAGLISVVWVLVGYSFAFEPGENSLFGGFDYVGLSEVLGSQSEAAPTIPHALFVAFQGTFAIITLALISGAFAERMRFQALVIFIFFWSILIYAPLVHWVWGGGWIATKIGALDFAGGTVMHIASDIAALITAEYLGKRIDYGHGPMPPHNLPLTVTGAGLLWVGWFGFNAGSAFGANEVAALALLNTNTVGAAGALAWLLVEQQHSGKPTVLSVASSAVAGLVCITPAAGFLTPLASILIGLAGGALCYTAVSCKSRFGFDDALDVVGIHLIGGILGALATSVFATASVNPAVSDLALGPDGGLLYGHPVLVWQQFLAVIATIVFSGVGTLLILVGVNTVIGVSVDEDQEISGLDLSQHRERAYSISQAP